jgi:hypothetical protein
VTIHTSLNVTGRPAQFGRSLLPEVSGKLITQFADNLEALIASDGAAASETAQDEAADSGEEGGSAVAATATQPAAPLPQQEESLNLIKLVGGPILKRVIPIAAAGALIAIFGRRIRGLVRRSKS